MTKRGYLPTDEREFSGLAVKKLYQAGQDLYYLLNHGYKMKGASTFVGNHYLLSERQRLCLTRAIASKESIEHRKEKEIKWIPEGSTISVDGFNTIITLEIALSESLLLRCMDGAIRDLAGLRGTYHLIDKTQSAILLLGDMLEKNKVKEVVFYVDAPVSNSGKLKQCILENLTPFCFDVKVETIRQVDSTLKTLEYVVSSDAIILDQCRSWINLNQRIIDSYKKEYAFIDFTHGITNDT